MIMRDHDTESSFRSTRPDRLGSLVLALVISLVTLWVVLAALFLPLLAALLRIPGAHPPWWLVGVFCAAASFLSGVVTMLFLRRSLGPAPRLASALTRVAVLASACMLLGLLAPTLMDAYIETGDSTEMLSFHAWVYVCAFWLCWVADGLAVSLPRLGRRERTEHSP